ncbi:MAG: KH domain-containing protein [Thermoplasmatales archaeon]|nr:KH domain-containing protein [Thermoplasmatales archaeon]MCK5261629.1 KH domain-containing protein [Thermoplasmatales archaeon]
MPNEERKIVLPSQILGDIKSNKAGRGTFIENGKIISEKLGILNANSNFINVIPLEGRYEPTVGDFIIGVVEEALSAGWLVDINAPSPAFLHVNEVPWDVEFGDTEKYLNRGDSIMAKVSQIDELKKFQITLKDRNLYKIKGGHIIEVEPSRVPRIIGKKGSMIALIKKYIRCRVFVGQNGKIWVDGDTKSIERVLQTIYKIESEAITFGLTNRIEELLKKDAKDVR